MKPFCAATILCCLEQLVLSQDSTTIPETTAKKSIFATSDNLRENSFVASIFGPLIDSDNLEQISFDDYTCGAPSKFRFDSGFEVHSPYTPYHESGGFDVETVESHYAAKWKNLMQQEDWHYDAILDNSMAFWVTDLADYYGYDENNLDRVYLQWQWKDETYYSMIVHNAEETGDLNQFEFISDTFTGVADSKYHKNTANTNSNINSNINSNTVSFVASEPRACLDAGWGNYALLCEALDYSIMPVGMRRAVSNLEDNVDWYLDVFSSVISDTTSQVHIGNSIDANGNKVRFAFLLLDEDDGFTVSFFERSGKRSSFGDLSIADFESNLHSAHAGVMLNPFCCVDRWYDMHYAIPLGDEGKTLSILEKVMQSGGRYTVFLISEPQEEAGQDGSINIGMFWALVEPNGQMVQIPGPSVDLDTGVSEHSGSSIQFLVEPSYWDGDWCPMVNKEEYSLLGFGDDIAVIDIKEQTFGVVVDAKQETAVIVGGVNGAVGVWSTRMAVLIFGIIAVVTIGCLMAGMSIRRAYYFGGKYSKIKFDNNNNDSSLNKNKNGEGGYSTFQV